MTRLEALTAALEAKREAIAERPPWGDRFRVVKAHDNLAALLTDDTIAALIAVAEAGFWLGDTVADATTLLDWLFRQLLAGKTVTHEQLEAGQRLVARLDKSLNEYRTAYAALPPLVKEEADDRA